MALRWVRMGMAVLTVLLVCSASAQAGKLRDLLVERHVEGRMVENGNEPQVASDVLIKGDTAQWNIPYGPHEKNKIDVYTPPGAKNAPMVLMVHGGGWRYGDRAYGKVVRNKAKHFLSKGFVFVSIGYRLMPDAYPLDQAKDVSAAIAYVQQNAANWGGDATRIILMGHSAGAHLVSLLTANPEQAAMGRAQPWRGTVALDSAAMDVEKMMTDAQWLPSFYHDAFGSDRNYWHTVSPYDQLSVKARPMLLVCSLKRGEQSCGQMQRFAEKAKSMGVSVDVLPEDLSHGDINGELGLPSDYTQAVDAFIDSLVR